MEQIIFQTVFRDAPASPTATPPPPPIPGTPPTPPYPLTTPTCPPAPKKKKHHILKRQYALLGRKLRDALDAVE